MHAIPLGAKLCVTRVSLAERGDQRPNGFGWRETPLSGLFGHTTSQAMSPMNDRGNCKTSLSAEG